MGIPSNPPEQRRCRAGCNKVETIAHVLQQCPTTHWERIRRHNEVAKKIAHHSRLKGWATEEERHIRHTNGTLFKLDLAITKDDAVLVIDVGISWEDSQSLSMTWAAKKRVYDQPTFYEAAATRWPSKTIVVSPLILGARGIWPDCNRPTVELIDLPSTVRASCIHSTLKWSSSINAAFGRVVW